MLLEGNAAALRLEMNRAPLGEVLTALQNQYGVRYRASVNLDRLVTATYSGSLERVIAQLLDGYDFIVKTSPGAVEIALLQEKGMMPVIAPASAAPPRGMRTSISRPRP